MARRSSSDKKQNLEKTNLFESRYSDKLFCLLSSSSDKVLSSVSLPSQVTQAAKMLGVFELCSMIFLKVALFFSNFLLYSLSCCLMSSFPTKIPSKYIHFFCTCNQTSILSEIKLRALYQYLILLENAPAYLLEATVWRLAN